MINQGSLEDGVLILLCFSSEHAPLLALKITEPRFFSNPVNQKIAQTSIEYIQKYGSCPGIYQLEYLLEADLQRGESGKLLGKTIHDLSTKVSQVQPQFIFQELDRFLEARKYTTNLMGALELFQEGKNEEAKSLIYKTQSNFQDGSTGLWMRDPGQALSFLDRNQDEDFFTSGVEILDQMGFRPERKTFVFIIAAAKKGKSWFLINVGRGGLQHHKKVLHITLEISEEKTARRYIQSIFALTKSEAEQIKVPFFTHDENSLTIQFKELQREGIFNKRKEIQTKLKQWCSCPDWIIKEFPTASLSTEQLELYLDSLEKQKGFKPDLVIIDYADLMQIDASSLRIDTGRLYRELRGIAVRRNFALVSASQGNRESEDAKVVRSTNVAEDWSKIGTADGVLTYSQTEDEYKLRLARLFVAATREEQGRYMVLITQAYPIGQFALDSTIMTPSLLEEIKRVGEAK